MNVQVFVFFFIRVIESSNFCVIAHGAVSVNELEALSELYKNLSCSIIKDGLIHKVNIKISVFSIFQLRSSDINFLMVSGSLVSMNSRR